MRKVLLLLAMIVTMAAPAFAQQAEMAAIPSPEARPAAAAQAPAAATTAPTIHVERAEIREQVRLAEEGRETRQDGPNSTRWWWLVAAVAVGVVVAAVLID